MILNVYVVISIFIMNAMSLLSVEVSNFTFVGLFKNDNVNIVSIHRVLLLLEELMSQLPEKMSAVVCHGPQDYRLEHVPTPVPKAKELVIKVKGCGICAGDCKCKNGAKMFWGETPWVKPPVVPGHEFYGHIVALGEGTESKYKIGERVIAEQIVPCWDCRYCKSGSYWMCETHNIYGFQKMSQKVAWRNICVFLKMPLFTKSQRA